MLTKDEKKMLRVMAAYNEATEEQVENAIVKKYLDQLMRCGMVSEMALPISQEETPEKLPAPLPDWDPKLETPEQPKERKKPGPKPKKKTVGDVAREIEETEREGKMSREEFVDYFSQRGEA